MAQACTMSVVNPPTPCMGPLPAFFSLTGAARARARGEARGRRQRWKDRSGFRRLLRTLLSRRAARAERARAVQAARVEDQVAVALAIAAGAAAVALAVANAWPEPQDWRSRA